MYQLLNGLAWIH